MELDELAETRRPAASESSSPSAPDLLEDLFGETEGTPGLSEFAVRQRTQRMIEEGVMRIVAITDPETLGRRLRATLGIRLTGDIHRLTAAFDALEEIDFVVSTAGAYDLLAEVQCKDEPHLNALLNEIRKHPEVHSIDAAIYLEFHKRTYAWPPGSRPPATTA